VRQLDAIDIGDLIAEVFKAGSSRRVAALRMDSSAISKASWREQKPY